MKGILIIVVAVCCWSCVRTPTAPASPEAITPMSGGCYVICEGLWHQDNSVASYVDPERSIAVRDVLAANDPTHRLGDTAGDVAVKGDTMYVAVATSHAIEVLRVSTGTWLGRIVLPASQQPRSVVIANDSVGYCTNISDDSFTQFNARTFEVLTGGVRVGPAPDGMAVVGGRLFIGNSGYGDLRAKEDGAGTVTVVSTTDLTALDTLHDLPNVGVIRGDEQRGLVWIAYRQLPSATGLAGGVVCYDARRLERRASWSFKGPVALDVNPATGACYVLHAQGIDELTVEDPLARRVISHTTTSQEAWYSLAVQPQRSVLWIGNARNYVIDGEAICVTMAGDVIARMPVGLNPAAFAFVP